MLNDMWFHIVIKKYGSVVWTIGFYRRYLCGLTLYIYTLILMKKELVKVLFDKLNQHVTKKELQKYNSVNRRPKNIYKIGEKNPWTLNKLEILEHILP